MAVMTAAKKGPVDNAETAPIALSTPHQKKKIEPMLSSISRLGRAGEYRQGLGKGSGPQSGDGGHSAAIVGDDSMHKFPQIDIATTTPTEMGKRMGITILASTSTWRPTVIPFPIISPINIAHQRDSWNPTGITQAVMATLRTRTATPGVEWPCSLKITVSLVDPVPSLVMSAHPDHITGALIPPISLSTTFAQLASTRSASTGGPEILRCIGKALGKLGVRGTLFVAEVL
ncbi:hypothetical protein EV421DRAFT_1735920 [Armillaria borealis]|uniref:Uncharacterized protein n=1 Tax=Armillaria borealis TaxID=47425 RepID=A0AA39MQZ6_9AGAR|nr:hypothetical protein EV421DRAFT_1735920 [Armillaria borealis]